MISDASRMNREWEWLTLRFVHEIQDVCVVGGLERALVVVLCAFEHFCQTGEVDAERHWPVAAISLEARRCQVDGNERDVRVVHGLEIHALLSALKVGVGDELFDG